MHRAASRINCDRHRHILNLKLVNSLHTQLREGNNLSILNRLGNQISRTAYSHQVNRAELFDCINRNLSSLGFTNHAQQSCLLQHLMRKLIHSRCCSWPSRTYNFITNRIDRTNVIDESPFQINRKLFTCVKHFYHFLVRSISASQHFARQQDGIAWLQISYFFLGHCIQIDALDLITRFPGNFRPIAQTRRCLQGRPRTVQNKMCVTRRCAIRNHGNRKRCSMRWIILDLDIKHRRETTKPLSPNT